MSDDHSGNADDVSGITWPGFVDIMSSVIMMFIFFVLITSVALYFHTITYKSKIMAEIDNLAESSSQKKTEDIVKENKQLKTQIDKVIEVNKSLEAKIAEIEDKTKKSDAKFAESNEQAVIVDATQEKLTLFFGADSISLTEDTLAQYESFMQAFFKTVTDKSRVHVEVLASKDMDKGNEQLAQEVATARLMNARNVLIKTDIPRENIMVQIVPSEAIDGKDNWVTIRVRQE